MDNILNMRPEEDEMENDLNRRKIDAVRQLASEFASRIEAVKADLYLFQPVKRGEIMAKETQPNDPAAQLGVAVKAALDDPQLTREAKLQSIQAALNNYAEVVKAEIDAVAPPAPGEEIAAAIEKSLGALLQSLTEQIGLLNAKLGQRSAPAAPAQKSYAPGRGPLEVGPQEGLPTSPMTGKPSPLTAMIRRSVGLIE